jgi:hypothetical protein
MAVEAARALTHIFLVIAFFGMLIGFTDHHGLWALAVTVGAFLLCYFTWVGLVLFGYMNFALSAMLLFVISLGGCIGLLTTGDAALMFVGGTGLFILVFATVIPVSRFDPTSEQKHPRSRRSGPALMMVTPFICVGLLTTGEPFLVLVGALGLALLAIGVMLPHGPHGRPEWREWDRVE